MCIGGSTKVAEAQPIQQAPTAQDATVTASATESARRQRAAAGAQSTVLTSGTTDVSAPLLGRTLLGA